MLIIALACALAFLSPAGASSSPHGQDARASWRVLEEGNRRFVAEKLLHPDQTLSRVHQTSKEQHPIAAILGCADSRVSPEILFDQGLGDLFIVREAGNVVDDDVLGSLEYAVAHLHVPLVVVLGHKSCGAVDAAIHHEGTGHLLALVKKIEPALRGIKEADPRRKFDRAVEANILQSVAQISTAHPVIAEAIAAGRVMVIGASYDLGSGKVVRLGAL